jgi:suppressor of fused
MIREAASVEDEAPGWDAIDQALAPLVGDAEPMHWGTGTMLPDQDGIWGISAYRRPDHWLFVTYGLTELFAKVSDEPAVSGWGFELTMRIAPDGSDAPPAWTPGLLSRLGELVFERSTPFQPGGRLEVPNASGGAPPALCWVEDPELAPVVESPNGSFTFVATLGVATDVLDQMRASSTREVIESVRATNPLLVSGGPGLTWSA